MQRIFFLDRDGVINEDYNYVYKIKNLRLKKGIKKGLSYIKKKGYLLVLVTNQSLIGRGKYTILDTEKFNLEIERRVGIKFDHIYICPHTKEENCKCRKPQIGNYLKKKYKEFNLSKSYFVGDKISDINCGKIIGCKTIFIKNKQYPNSCSADFYNTSLFNFITKHKNDI